MLLPSRIGPECPAKSKIGILSLRNPEARELQNPKALNRKPDPKTCRRNKALHSKILL